VEIRKTTILKETTLTDGAGRPCAPINRVVAMVVIRNPFAGRDVEDLSALFDMGGVLAESLMPEMLAALPGAPVSYGKVALVGVAGDMEHGGAMIHRDLPPETSLTLM